MTEPRPFGFYQAAAAGPERIAVIHNEDSHTYGSILTRVNRISWALRWMGLGEGDAVAALLKNGVEYLELSLAIGQVGMCLVPISSHLTPTEVEYIIRDSEAKALVATASLAERLDSVLSSLPTARYIAGGRHTSWRPYEELTHHDNPDLAPPDRLVGTTMGYTSGTTGRPKGVRKPRQQVTPEAALAGGALSVNLFGVHADAGTHLCCSPLYHNAPGWFAVEALHLGHTVVIHDRFDGAAILRDISRHRVTWSHMVPTHFLRLLEVNAEIRATADVSSVEALIHAGAPCPQPVKCQMIDWFGPRIWEYYGATEGMVTVASPCDWLAKPGTVGRPLDGVTVRVLDNHHCEVGVDEEGTIFFSADFEYHSDPVKTAASRVAGLVTVGDIGRIDADGYLFLLDRRTDLIISGGVNIYPAEIEELLVTHPLVRDAAVVAVPDESWGQSALALIELLDCEAPTEQIEEELRSRCRGNLASYKNPRFYEFRTTLGRNAAGKLSRAALRAPYWAETEPPRRTPHIQEKV